MSDAIRVSDGLLVERRELEAHLLNQGLALVPASIERKCSALDRASALLARWYVAYRRQDRLPLVEDTAEFLKTCK